MVRRNISAPPRRVKRRGLERTTRLAARLAAARGEGAADRAFHHVVDLARLLGLNASLLLLLARRLAAAAVDLAQQAKAEPDGADDGDENQQLGRAGKTEHAAI